jgi:hypothetical protein
VVGIAVVAVAAMVAGLVSLNAFGHGGAPASGGDVVRDHPLEFVPEGWPTVDIGDPADGYRMPAEVAGAAGPVRVIASGTVDGEGFSFQSYVGAGPSVEESGPCLGFAGPGLDRFASPDPQPPGAAGGISSSTCAHAQGVPARADLYLAGQLDPGQAPDVAPNYGFLSPRVARLQVRLDDGSVADIPLLESPSGWDGFRPFLFFPPAGHRGVLTAFGGDGTELARASICAPGGAAGAGGCGGPVTQLAPIPTGAAGS